MWRASITLGVLVWALPAHAGVLSQAVGGIDHAAGAEPGKSSGGSSSGGSKDSSSSSGSSHADSGGCCWSDPTATLGYGPPPQPPGPMESELYAGVQSVEGSDGSVTLEMRSSWKDFGIGVRGSSWYEQTGREQYVHLDLWSIGGQWRVDHEGKLSVWAEIGFAGINNNDDVSLSGLTAGLHMTRKLDGQLSISAAARRFFLQHDIAANEVHVGLHLAILELSYRVMDFNVGPPLHGPEVGLAFMF
jgi:hypothetical protein